MVSPRRCIFGCSNENYVSAGRLTAWSLFFLADNYFSLLVHPTLIKFTSSYTDFYILFWIKIDFTHIVESNSYLAQQYEQFFLFSSAHSRNISFNYMGNQGNTSNKFFRKTQEYNLRNCWNFRRLLIESQNGPTLCIRSVSTVKSCSVSNAYSIWNRWLSTWVILQYLLCY